jgi:hypothetical protein
MEKNLVLMTIFGVMLAFGMTGMGCDIGNEDSDDHLIYRTFEVNDNTTFSDTLEQIKNDNAPSGGEYTIKVMADVTLSVGKLISGSNYNGKNIVLKGVGEERTIQYTKNDYYTLFEISAGTLTLDEHIILKGVNNNNKALCIARDDGTIVIKEGAKIMGNTNTRTGDRDAEGYFGGGGILLLSGGRLYMYGGEITGNDANAGAGVAIFGGTFTMEDGKIHRNNVSGVATASFGGGVHLNFEGDIFNMNGGYIEFNKAVVNGGGVSVCCGTFTMSGNAVVSDNEAGVTGGGVAICCSTFIMKDGIIKHNKAAANNTDAQNRILRYGGGLGRWGSASNAKPFPGIFDAPVIFRKTGGTIYGINADPSLANTVVNAVPDAGQWTSANNGGNQPPIAKGDAIYLLREYKNTTSSPEDTYDFMDNEEYNPKNYQ